MDDEAGAVECDDKDNVEELVEGEVVDGDDGGDDGGDRTPSTRLFSQRRERSHQKKTHNNQLVNRKTKRNDRRTTPGVLLEEVMDVGTRRAGVCTEMYVFAGHRGSVGTVYASFGKMVLNNTYMNMNMLCTQANSLY